jgi:hypothetical protein
MIKLHFIFKSLLHIDKSCIIFDLAFSTPTIMTKQIKISPPPSPPASAHNQMQWLHTGWCSFVLSICFAHDYLIWFFHNIVSDILFTTQYLPYCTTKYIFWLGKNKFDRGGRLPECC